MSSLPENTPSPNGGNMISNSEYAPRHDPSFVHFNAEPGPEIGPDSAPKLGRNPAPGSVPEIAGDYLI